MTGAISCFQIYEKIRSGKQEKLFHEIIIQIGDRESCGAATEDGRLAAEILNEYMKEFQERNPNLRLFSAHLYMDETTPYLYIDFVSYTSGSTRGLGTRVSLKKALTAQGFSGGTRSETEWNQWANAEKKALAAVMERHEIACCGEDDYRCKKQAVGQGAESKADQDYYDGLMIRLRIS